MKYKILLKSLQALIYIKRFFWWFGSKITYFFGFIFLPILKFFGYLGYRFEVLTKRFKGLADVNRKLFKRDYLQVFIFLILFFVAIPQTKLYSRASNVLPGQKSIAYTLVSNDHNFEMEEIIVKEDYPSKTAQPSWKQGVISSEEFINTELLDHNRELPSEVIAGGLAVTKPIIFPGAIAGGHRNSIEEYIVQSGDTISGIAYRYNISEATILWENNLNISSYLQPGDKIRILPISGLAHSVKSGDTLLDIADSYGVKVENIIKYNKLKNEGASLQIGQQIIIPNGVRHYQSAVIAQTTPARTVWSSNINIPPSSREGSSASGFVWPAAMRMITQYYSWYHTAIDVSGPVGVARGSATYASKSGVVEVSQCGWNLGYGCYVIINHGGGIKTLYGHHDKLLVSIGDYVKAGQAIGLMGNTGKVYGYDGVHLHFEIIINGVKVNPLGYVK